MSMRFKLLSSPFGTVPMPQLLLQAPGFGHSTFSESLLLGPGISLAFPLPWPLQLCLLGLLCLLLGMSVLTC